MRTSTIVLCLILFGSLVSSVAAAERCPLYEFDRDDPPHVSDLTPPTEQSYFEWGSDVDPWSEGARGWHYIRNEHSRDLSLHWEKPNLLISFDLPKATDEIACKYDYGPLDSYELDYHAPIDVDGDTRKSAVAYVQKTAISSTANEEAAPTAGAEIAMDYVSEAGETLFVFARMILRYFPPEELLEIILESGPGATGIGFSPADLGLDEETLRGRLNMWEATATAVMPLQDLVEIDDFASDVLSDVEGQEFIVVEAGDGISLKFEGVSRPSGSTPLVLVNSERVLVGATRVNLEVLAGG